MSDFGKAEEADNVEGDIDASEQSEVQLPCEDQQGVKDNSPGVESSSAQDACANETGLHKTESAGSESVANADGTQEDMKTEESAAESSEVKESSVEGDDQKKRFVVFCLLEQKWLLESCYFGSFVNKFGCSWGGVMDCAFRPSFCFCHPPFPLLPLVNYFNGLIAI